MIARDLSRTHDELLETVSSFELSRWKALYAIESEEREVQRNQAEPSDRRR